ncbi:hypothetical protein INR49_010923, partial [Caranx melampygus]
MVKCFVSLGNEARSRRAGSNDWAPAKERSAFDGVVFQSFSHGEINHGMKPQRLYQHEEEADGQCVRCCDHHFQDALPDIISRELPVVLTDRGMQLTIERHPEEKPVGDVHHDGSQQIESIHMSGGVGHLLQAVQ